MCNHPGRDTTYFKFGCRMQIIADASPVGLGVVLSQQQRVCGELSHMLQGASLTWIDATARQRRRDWPCFWHVNGLTCMFLDKALRWEQITSL